jgi:hypothetical protein
VAGVPYPTRNRTRADLTARSVSLAHWHAAGGGYLEVCFLHAGNLAAVLHRKVWARMTLPELGRVLGSVPLAHVPPEVVPHLKAVEEWLASGEARR